MSAERPDRRGRRRFLVVGLLILTGLSVPIVWLLRPPIFSGPPVPDPNGYDTLLAAGKLVEGMPPAEGVASKATDEELRAFVASNAKALAAARAGFAEKSLVPLGRMKSLEAHFEEAALFRPLGRVLTCQMVLARREGRTSEALQASVDLLRLAHTVAHGGVLVDQLTGAAIQRPAIDEIAGPLLPKLSSADARRVIAELDRLGRNREPIKTIADRDLAFALAVQGLRMRVAYAMHRKTLDGLRAPAIKAVESAESRSESRIRYLLVQLALHAYALDHPEKPQPGDLQALVPAYLPEVPLMPGNGRRLTLDDFKPEPETTLESLERH